MLEVLVGLYGEGRGAGDGEGCGQPGGVGMGLSGGDEGLDGLEGWQGGRGGGRCPVPLRHQGDKLLEVEPEAGLWRSGHEYQAPLAARTKLAVVVETERCCTVRGGRWQLLPMATMHMDVWWASSSGTAERPSSMDNVSWELGAGPAQKRVSQSDGDCVAVAEVGDGGGGAGTRDEDRCGERGRRRGPRELRGDRSPLGERGGRQRRWPW